MAVLALQTRRAVVLRWLASERIPPQEGADLNHDLVNPDTLQLVLPDADDPPAMLPE